MSVFKMYSQDNTERCQDRRVQFKLQSVGLSVSTFEEVKLTLEYRRDEGSAELFKEAGVELRRHVPPPRA